MRLKVKNAIHAEKINSDSIGDAILKSIAVATIIYQASLLAQIFMIWYLSKLINAPAYSIPILNIVTLSLNDLVYIRSLVPFINVISVTFVCVGVLKILHYKITREIDSVLYSSILLLATITISDFVWSFMGLALGIYPEICYYIVILSSMWEMLILYALISAFVGLAYYYLIIQIKDRRQKIDERKDMGQKTGSWRFWLTILIMLLTLLYFFSLIKAQTNSFFTLMITQG